MAEQKPHLTQSDVYPIILTVDNGRRLNWTTHAQNQMNNWANSPVDPAFAKSTLVTSSHLPEFLRSPSPTNTQEVNTRNLAENIVNEQHKLRNRLTAVLTTLTFAAGALGIPIINGLLLPEIASSVAVEAEFGILVAAILFIFLPICFNSAQSYSQAVFEKNFNLQRDTLKKVSQILKEDS